MDSDMVSLDKKPDITDVLRVLIDLKKEEQKNMYYVLAGLKLSEKMQKSEPTTLHTNK
jgi:hypothetical protein